MLSVVTLTWDQIHFTKKFVESIRKHTKVPYELIIVDNGSSDGTQEYIRQQADKYHFYEKNTGFAHGFNKGMELASGEYIAICNNDTEFPAEWFEKLSQTFETDPKCGLVYPCYTKGMKIAERWWPGRKIIKLPPFNKEVPSGVAILAKLDVLREKLGGFSEDYEIAGGEDLDLCFKTWAADYNIYIDQRVLIKHKSKGTAGKKLPNWKELYTKNGKIFEEKWKDYLS
jgi:GT2 family glycosyltransferase